MKIRTLGHLRSKVRILLYYLFLLLKKIDLQNQGSEEYHLKKADTFES